MSLSTMLPYRLVLLAVVCSAYTENSLPSYIKPCSFKDKSINECVKEQIENALPHFTKGDKVLGIPSTDPLKVNDLNIDGEGLKLLFSDAEMHGLKNAKLTDLKISLGKRDEAFQISFVVDLKVVAKYVADGKILFLPIKGDGDATVYAHKVLVAIESTLTHVKESDGEHFKLTSPTYKYTIEKTTFELKNLFNGNKELSDAIHKVANENWQQLMDELAPKAIKQIVKAGVKAINQFFSIFTIAQLVKD